MSESITCPECGQTPMGEACYHICSHSVHYYTPEQERYDEAFYGAADRWEGYGDPDLYPDEDYDESSAVFGPVPCWPEIKDPPEYYPPGTHPFEAIGLLLVDTTDIPF